MIFNYNPVYFYAFQSLIANPGVKGNFKQSAPKARLNICPIGGKLLKKFAARIRKIIAWFGALTRRKFFFAHASSLDNEIVSFRLIGACVHQ